MRVSQIRAVWFLPGVAALYPERRIAAFVSRWELPRGERYLELLRSPRSFWVYEEGRFRQGDPAMLQRLFREGQ